MALTAGSSDSAWVLVLASAANLMVGLDALVVSTALTERMSGNISAHS